MVSMQHLVVIGGSYVGVNTAQQLAKAFYGRFRVILIEQNSHFQHLFAFPRFAVVPDVDTHKAFIPYNPGTFSSCPPESGIVIQAKVTSVSKASVQLDRKVVLDDQSVDSISYSYLVLATGTKLSPPSTLPGSEKTDGVIYLRKHAQRVRRSQQIAIIGGGAVGIQMATDIKELHPEKSVIIIHSRKTVMNRFDARLHDLIANRCNELGITMSLGSRVKLPAKGYPTDGCQFEVELESGDTITADFAIICTGQIPQSDLVRDLSPDLVNPDGFVKTLKTLQIGDSKYPNVFALGDIAATGAHKAARPGGAQAELVAKNIQHLMKGEMLDIYDNIPPAAIHLTLGITKSVVFGNPPPGSEPMIKHKDDGRLDMGIDGVWTRRGGGSDEHR